MAAAVSELEVSQTSKDNGKGNGLLLYYHQYSFYSQKVVMALHEKKLPFKSHIVNLTKGEQFQPWFLQINPRGEVPVLKDGFKVIPDSSRILEYLEDNFSNGDAPRLIPLDQGPEVKQKVLHFRTIIDQLPTGVITMGSFFHPEFSQNPKPPFIRPVIKLLQAAEMNSSANLRKHAENNHEFRDILLQKAKVQDVRHEKLLKKEEFKKVLDQVSSVLGEVEDELASHKEGDWWLCSDRFTVADIALTILLDRLYRLGLDQYFWGSGKKPHVSNYYRRVQLRESYKKAVPSTLFHLKTLFHMQTPLIIGIGVVAALAVILGGIFYFKKN